MKETLPSYSVGSIDGDAKYPEYSVKSEKYHLEQMSGNGLSGLYLIKEIHESTFVAGIEGNKGTISLELIKINQRTGEESKPIWSISESANLWKFQDGYIVFVNRGCCGAQDQHIYFDISTGQKNRILETEPKRIINTEPVYVFPG